MPTVVMNVFVELGMNERIKEIAEQSGVTVLTTHGMKDVVDGCYIIGPAHLQKFAELIVCECMELTHWKDYDISAEQRIRLSVYQEIKEHFGIKE